MTGRRTLLLGAGAGLLSAWEWLTPLPRARRPLDLAAGVETVGLHLDEHGDFPPDATLAWPADAAGAPPPATLRRTGAFTRRVTILFVELDIYRVASYLENPRPALTEHLLADLLVDGARRALALRFLRTITGAQLREAFEAEIANCFGDVDRVRHAEPLRRFLEAFSDGAQAGETVYLAWLPGGRFHIGRNDPRRLQWVVTDVPFARAVWRIWSAETAGDERYQLVADFALDP